MEPYYLGGNPEISMPREQTSAEDAKCNARESPQVGTRIGEKRKRAPVAFGRGRVAGGEGSSLPFPPDVLLGNRVRGGGDPAAVDHGSTRPSNANMYLFEGVEVHGVDDYCGAILLKSMALMTIVAILLKSMALMTIVAILLKYMALMTTVAILLKYMALMTTVAILMRSTELKITVQFC